MIKVKVDRCGYCGACVGVCPAGAIELAETRLLISEMCEDDAQFAAYLDEYVYGVDEHAEYLEKIGPEALERIRAVPPFGYAPGLQRG